ncbi:MAG TPA: hypothetical protein VMF11_13610 [Candidatus Baltobacteraceae bacterium]|nr:hypothetical protein [Candidatus Baltobacteraceae bacterium]
MRTRQDFPVAPAHAPPHVYVQSTLIVIVTSVPAAKSCAHVLTAQSPSMPDGCELMYPASTPLATCCDTVNR